MQFVRKTNKAMKWIFGVICLTASLAAVSATFCKTEDDCKKGYCCVGLTTNQMMKKGLCLRLTKERRQCNEPEAKNDYYGGKYMRYCPCDEGMICEPNKPGITDPEKWRKALRCQRLKGTTAGPDDVTTASNIVTDGEIVTNPDDDETLPPEIVTDETEAPEVVETEAPEVVETEAPEEEVVETEAPEEEVVETEAPEEEVVETEAPEEEVVETEAPEEEVVETEAPEEEVVETEAPGEEVVETEAPEEEVVETEAPEEEVVETEAPEEEVVEEETEAPEEEVPEEIPEEAGQRGPGGDHPREDDPDCEDWTYGC